jgi:hypothetical protein
MTTDAGLPHLIQTNLPLVDWARVETWAVGPGMPDLNGCYLGQDVWVECKATYGWMVSRVRIPQVAWLERRARAGGRCWVAVRQRGSRRDSLWLLGPGAARLLREKVRLDELPPTLVHQVWEGGPKAWPWEKVQDAMFFLSVF